MAAGSVIVGQAVPDISTHDIFVPVYVAHEETLAHVCLLFTSGDACERVKMDEASRAKDVNCMMRDV